MRLAEKNYSSQSSVLGCMWWWGLKGNSGKQLNHLEPINKSAVLSLERPPGTPKEQTSSICAAPTLHQRCTMGRAGGPKQGWGWHCKPHDTWNCSAGSKGGFILPNDDVESRGSLPFCWSHRCSQLEGEWAALPREDFCYAVSGGAHAMYPEQWHVWNLLYLGDQIIVCVLRQAIGWRNIEDDG